MDRRNKIIQEDMKKNKAILQIKEDEERVTRLLKQRTAEEAEQKRRLDLLYRKKEDLKR